MTSKWGNLIATGSCYMYGEVYKREPFFFIFQGYKMIFLLKRVNMLKRITGVICTQSNSAVNWPLINLKKSVKLWDRKGGDGCILHAYKDKVIHQEEN